MSNAFNRLIFRPARRSAPLASCLFAITLLVASCAKSPPRLPAPLDSNVVAKVDRLYPGFLEILQTRDPIWTPHLAATLSANPGPETLSVLLWMLRYSPLWNTSSVSAEAQAASVARAVGTLPFALLGDTLRHGDADKRLGAAFALGNTMDRLVPAAEKESLQNALIDALSDPNVHVREAAAGALRIIGTDRAKAALARSVNDPNVTDTFYWQAMDQHRRVRMPGFGDAAFPTSTIAHLSRVIPHYMHAVATWDEGGVEEIFRQIEHDNAPDATPFLVWFLRYGDVTTYGSVVDRLSQPPHRNRLPIAALAHGLAQSHPHNRLAIVRLFAALVRAREARLAARDRELVIAALLQRLRDPDIDVRTEAAQTLGATRVARAVGPLVSSLDRRDVTEEYVSIVIGSLASIGNRDALRFLDRWARSAPTLRTREDAAVAFIAIAKPSDPGRETRRLLWEQPDTELERRVLAGRRSALPLAWQALATGSDRDKRAAAALLGWFPDENSIRPILAALDNSPGALTRNQLLFDLNMILLAVGVPADVTQRNTLASLHLRWMYDRLANEAVRPDIRSAVLAQNVIGVFPDRILPPFLVELSAQSARDNTTGAPAKFVASATLAESPQAFRDFVAKDGCGVAFHEITVAEGVARVATTLYLPRGAGSQIWISLYRYHDGRWLPLWVPAHPVPQWTNRDPNLLPTVNRNYGADHPLKILRLDLTMERVRVDLNANRDLENENLDQLRTSTAIDQSYIPLLERYTRSGALSVKYTAEYQLARLTGQPNLQLWIDTLAQQPGTAFQAMAIQVVGGYATREINSEGGEPEGTERDELVASAMSPEPIDPQLLPGQLPRQENIGRVRRSSRFGLVDTMFGTGPLGMNGYSMLFERRGDRWVFLCVVRSWIS
jgi:HEAT repeat protein